MPGHLNPIEMQELAVKDPRAVERRDPEFFKDADAFCIKTGITRQQLARVLNNVQAIKGMFAWANIDAYVRVLERT